MPKRGVCRQRDESCGVFWLGLTSSSHSQSSSDTVLQNIFCTESGGRIRLRGGELTLLNIIKHGAAAVMRGAQLLKNDSRLRRWQLQYLHSRYTVDTQASH